MPVEKKRLVWSKWVIANGAGVLAGATLATALIPLIALLLAAFGAPDKQPLNIFFLLAVAAGGFIGTAVGGSQWLILREIEQEIEARSWICATAIGTLFVWALMLSPGIRTGSASAPAFYQTAALSNPQVFLTALSLGALFGAILGIAQWTVLRTRLKCASWWIASSALAGAVALPLMLLALARAEAQTSYWSFWLIGTFSAAALGAACGGVTGLTLVQLHRRT